jgi:hypothetical protein
MLRYALSTFLALALVVLTTPVRTAVAPVAQAAELSATIPDVYVHVPKDRTSQPLQVLVALHGLGGNGEQFASNILAEADRNRWLVVAPTINYGDWTDPSQVASEDPRLIRWLDDFLDTLPAYVQAPVKSRVLPLSRARIAHRFCSTRGTVAALARTYTLPLERSDAGGMILPVGMTCERPRVAAKCSYRRHRVLVGVGSEDQSRDPFRAWDQYLHDWVQRA